MPLDQAYLIIDIGTGNVRVAVTKKNGEILSVKRDNVRYEKDELYPDALNFRPDVLWDQILQLSSQALSAVPGVEIVAISASSQREGIVLLDERGKALVGLPNHDHRGREWEHSITEKGRIYSLTGRFPSSLFSAMKVVGIRNRRREIYERMRTMLSMSDWAQYQFCGVAGYEHSQASETQLYDVARKKWSDDLCWLFGLPKAILPPLHDSGTIAGTILPEHAARLKISPRAVVIVGGADTQLAIKSTQPRPGDIVIVSGTTTPIVRIISEYLVDSKERTWTNRHVEGDNFILEANAGVTGLNYQRLKEVFYPNEGYDLIEGELDQLSNPQCLASLGSLVAEEKQPLTKGGFIFNAPVSHELTRASFVWATLWDIACCIKENYDCLLDVTRHDTDYVWACGGGFQSKMLRQSVATLIDKKVQVRNGFQQASVTGGALLCSEALREQHRQDAAMETVYPGERERCHALYLKWKELRAGLKQIF
ncbi:MAG TPA: FGGY family carbohydrate kinase [Chryseosolibacter sp.]